MIPDRTWYNKTISELIEIAKELGDHNANWVEQALEWAQRIHNGESWEELCNEPDNAKNFRVVVWKVGDAKIVGGSRNILSKSSATDISLNFHGNNYVENAVPLVVRYKNPIA